MEKMRAAVVRNFGDALDICEVEKPKIQKGKIIVKLVACGVSHTDLHAIKGDWPLKPQLPFIPGHEGVGYVDEIGEGVTAVKVGDRVCLPWLHTACGNCKYCESGWETLCAEQQIPGYRQDGGFAEFILIDSNFVCILPDSLKFAPAALLLCTGVTTVYKGLIETEVKPDETVVIIGINGLGQLAVQYAVAMGMNVIAVDRDDSKLKLAKSLGAYLTINAMTNDPIVELAKIEGAEGVLVTTLSASSITQGLAMLAKGGTMSLIGLSPGNFSMPLFNSVVTRNSIRGSIVGTRLDLEESLKFAAACKVTAQGSLDKLENINEIFKKMDQVGTERRVVIEM